MTRSSSLDIWSQSCPFALAGFGEAPSSQAPQCLLAPSPLLSSRNSRQDPQLLAPCRLQLCVSGL